MDATNGGPRSPGSPEETGSPEPGRSPEKTESPEEPGRSPALRASDRERDAVVQRVQEAFAEGRLDDTEFDERMRAALAARTHADLDVLLTDLPAGTGQVAAGPAPAGPAPAGPAPAGLAPAGPAPGKLAVAYKGRIRRAG